MSAQQSKTTASADAGKAVAEAGKAVAEAGKAVADAFLKAAAAVADEDAAVADEAVEEANKAVEEANKAVAEACDAIDANNTATDIMSLYIPRVDLRSFNNLPSPVPEPQMEDGIKMFIAKQFRYQHIGEVERVDLVSKQTPEGYGFYIAFIHFSKWYDTSAAEQLKQQVLDPNQKAKLQWHEQWYWIVNENKKPLDAKTVEFHEMIRVQQRELEEQTATIKNLEEQVKTFVSSSSTPEDLDWFMEDLDCVTTLEGFLKPPLVRS